MRKRSDVEDYFHQTTNINLGLGFQRTQILVIVATITMETHHVT